MTKEISTDAELMSRLLTTQPTPAECLVAAARVEQLAAALAAERAKTAKLVEALTLAANRLSRRAVDYIPGDRLFIETSEWADEARSAITEAGQ